jgi:hypothetical protein
MIVRRNYQETLQIKLLAAAITILALYARPDAVAQTCQDVLKAKPAPIA